MHGSHTGTRAHSGEKNEGSGEAEFITETSMSSHSQAAVLGSQGMVLGDLQTWCLLRTGKEVRGQDTGVEGGSVFLVS